MFCASFARLDAVAAIGQRYLKGPSLLGCRAYLASVLTGAALRRPVGGTTEAWLKPMAKIVATAVAGPAITALLFMPILLPCSLAAMAVLLFCELAQAGQA